MQTYQENIRALYEKVGSTPPAPFDQYPALLYGFLESLQEDFDEAGNLYHALQTEMAALPTHQHKD